jgi:hypothetical protein
LRHQFGKQGLRRRIAELRPWQSLLKRGQIIAALEGAIGFVGRLPLSGCIVMPGSDVSLLPDCATANSGNAVSPTASAARKER